MNLSVKGMLSRNTDLSLSAKKVFCLFGERCINVIIMLYKLTYFLNHVMKHIFKANIFGD